MDARNAAAIALSVAAAVLRLCAILLCALVIVLCFSGLVTKLGLVNLVVDLSRALPRVIAGWGVISSPFGGVFRLDFTVVAAALFLLDFACTRAARALR